MATIRRVLWLLAIIGAVAAMYVMIHAFRNAPTEQEVANCATIALAIAVIPYCLARAVAESNKRSD